MATKLDSGLIVHDGGLVKDVLDNAKPLANYATLRAYTGQSTGVRITTPGISGFFQRLGTAGLTDNGGTVIIDALGRAWERLVSGRVRVKWFGAIGNGISDDTLPVQAAIDFAVATGAELQAAAGIYMILPSRGTGDYATPRPGRGLFIDGPLNFYCDPGAEFRLFPSDKVDPSLLLVRNTKNVIIDGGTWTGDRYTHLGTTGEGGGLLMASCCENVTFRNAIVQNAWGDGAGAYSYPAKTVPESGSGYTSVPTVTISGGGATTDATAVAILGNGTTLGAAGTVHRCAVTNQGSGYTSQPIVTITGGGGSGAVAEAIVNKDGKVTGVAIVNSQINKNITFENCKVINNGRNNLTVGAVDGLIVSDCLFQGANRIAPKFGVDIEPDGNQVAGRNIIFYRNTFRDNVVGGLAFGGGSGCHKVTVRDNLFENNGVGFVGNNAYDVLVEGNRFYGGALSGSGGGGGITGKSKRCTIRGNFVDLNDKITLGKTAFGVDGGSSSVAVDGNTITRCNRGILLRDIDGCSFANNIFTDLGGQAFFQFNSLTNSIFIGNKISSNTGGDATQFSLATKCVFANNVFSDVYSNALYGSFEDCEIVCNTFTGWSTVLSNAAAILVNSMNGCLIQGNHFKAGPGSNFAIQEYNAPTNPSYVQHNYAAYTTTANPFQKLKAGTLCEDNHLARYSAAPTTGIWLVGQRVYNSSPAAGGNIGWVCTVAGSPGTWKAFGAISA